MLSNRWYLFVARIFQIWSTQAEYEESAGRLEPIIRNGEIFSMNNDETYQYVPNKNVIPCYTKFLGVLIFGISGVFFSDPQK